MHKNSIIRIVSCFLLVALMSFSASCAFSGKNHVGDTTALQDSTSTTVPLNPNTVNIPKAGPAVCFLGEGLKISAPASLPAPTDSKYVSHAADFSLNLLKAAEKTDSNALLSPLSVLIALAMTQNGANGQTLLQMEELLGMNVDDLNGYLYSFIRSLKNTDKAALVNANSVWVSSDRGFSADEEFIAKVKNYFSADIAAAHFDDPQTLPAINNWVNDNTDGMIEKILEQLHPDTIMIILNALTFDAEWRVKFENPAVDGYFTNSDKTTSTVGFMHSDESKFIDGDNETGFIKPYADGYSFVALLPDSGVDIKDYIASLDGDEFLSLVNKASNTLVAVKMPKFQLDYESELKEILFSLGMKDAFDAEYADFSKLGKTDDNTNVFVSSVIHKSHIEVDESGTRAAAVTAIIMNKATSIMTQKFVKLDRPFVYAIIDNTTSLPVFIGAVEHLG